MRAWLVGAIVAGVVGVAGVAGVTGCGGGDSGGGKPGADAGNQAGASGTAGSDSGATGGGGGSGGSSGGSAGSSGADAGAACVDPASCDPNATCARVNGVDVCTCRAGYDGDGHSCTDVDECAADPARCGHGGTCQNTGGGYVCNCPPGFEDTGGACTDIDECSAGTDNCTAPAVCDNTIGSFRCTCPAGYVLGSGTCDQCEKGYVESAPGVCTPGTIDCNVNAGVCAPGGTCVASATGDACQCSTGYEGLACGRCTAGYQDNDGDGTCLPDCGTAALACGAHQECSDTSGTATCVCSRGYTGTGCEQCASGFGDHFADGSCVALTCAASLLQCPAHAACYDGAYPPVCRCDIGWSGAACDACDATHQADGNGNCVVKTNLDPARYLLAAGTDDLARPVLGALDVTSWTFMPLTQLQAPVGALASDPMGPIYATHTSPNEVVRLDMATGAAQTVSNLGTYHGVNGLAFDSTRRRLYAGANIGAGKYLLTIQPDGTTTSGGTTVDTLDELGMTYDAATDTVRGLAGYLQSGTPLATFRFDAATGANYSAGAAIDVSPNLATPGLAYLGSTLYAAGDRADTEDEWVEAFCRTVSVALGVDTSGLPGDAVYNYNGVAPLGSITASSSGPVLHARGSYGDQNAARASLRVETDQPGDVVCIATREENIDLVIAAAARFRLLVVVSSFPTPRLQIESGFTPPATAADPPIRAAAGSSAPDPSFTGALVKTYDANAWYALKLPGPAYDPLLAPFPIAGTLDWTSAKIVTHPIAGVRLSGGLAPMPCCASLAAPAYCDASGRVAVVTGTCDATGACQSKTVVLDDCTDRTQHPVTYACTSSGATMRTPTCVDPGAADASCQFADTVLDACSTPGSCTTGTGGTLQYTSAEKCTASSSSAVCTTTTTACTDKAPQCTGGSSSTFATSCDPASGCVYTPTVTPCAQPAAYCSAGPPLEHVSYTATCADASTCGTPTETRTACNTQMCVGTAWVTYGTPTCDPVNGCGGNQIATQDCTTGESHVCADSKNMQWTRCNCVPGTGCVCTTTVEPCPDKPDQCVGTSGTTLRTYDPYCDAATNTCSWWSPDQVCPNFCSGGKCY